MQPHSVPEGVRAELLPGSIRAGFAENLSFNERQFESLSALSCGNTPYQGKLRAGQRYFAISRLAVVPLQSRFPFRQWKDGSLTPALSFETGMLMVCPIEMETPPPNP
jgi:hypothetical protein